MEVKTEQSAHYTMKHSWKHSYMHKKCINEHEAVL